LGGRHAPRAEEQYDRGDTRREPFLHHVSAPAYDQVISLSAIAISLGYRPAIKNTNEFVRINGAPQKYLVAT